MKPNPTTLRAAEQLAKLTPNEIARIRNVIANAVIVSEWRWRAAEAEKTDAEFVQLRIQDWMDLRGSDKAIYRAHQKAQEIAVESRD